MIYFTAVAFGACLSCLDMWKVRIPSVMRRKDMIGELVLVKKISGKALHNAAINIGMRHAIIVALDAKAHIPCLKAEIATVSRIPPHPLLLNLIGVCCSGGWLLQPHVHIMLFSLFFFFFFFFFSSPTYFA